MKTDTTLAQGRYRPLTAFKFRPAPMPSRSVGKTATLTQIPLDCLVVDERYQRSITPQGRSNIVRIVECFDWRMFSPLIVVPVEDGKRWAIIDGQHRATAALMHGAIRTVPCMVIDATPEQAAACFAAINGAVTSMNKGQMWHARVASGEHFACEVAAVCRRAGVSILKAKASEQSWNAGDTLAVGAIETPARRHGLAVLEATLGAVTLSRDGNPGFLRADVIKAVAANIVMHTASAEQARRALDAVSLADELDRATVAALADRAPVHTHLTTQLGERFAAVTAPPPEPAREAAPAATRRKTVIA